MTTAAVRKRRGLSISQKAGSRAQSKAATWVRINHPEVWAEIYAEAVEVERQRMAERERTAQL